MYALEANKLLSKGLKYSLSAVLLCYSASSLVFAETLPATSGITLTLDQYLKYLTANDPAYKQLKLDEKEIVYYIDSNIDGDAAQIDLQSEKGFGDDDVDTESLSAEISKEILDSGTSLSLSHSRTENPDRDESISQLQVEQSLLKNAFGKESRLQKKLLTKQEQIETLKALEAYEAYLGEKILLYIEYAQAQSEKVFLEALVTKSRSLYSYIKERRLKNAASKIDEMQASLQLLQREQDLLNSIETLEIAQQRLVVGTTLALELESLQAEQALDLTQRFPATEQVFDYQQLRTYKMVALNNEVKQAEYQIAKDDDLPDLSIYGGYKIDDSTRFTSSVNRKESSLGLKFSMPLGDKQSKAKESISALNQQQSELEQKIYSGELTSQHEQQKILLAKSKTQVALSAKKLKLIQGILEEETLRYRRGQLDIDRIIDTNNDLYRYQLELNQNRLAYNQAYLDWLVFNDLIVGSKEALSKGAE